MKETLLSLFQEIKDTLGGSEIVGPRISIKPLQFELEKDRVRWLFTVDKEKRLLTWAIYPSHPMYTHDEDILCRYELDGGKRLKYLSGIVNQTEDSHVECGCFLGKFVPAKKVRQVSVSGFKKIEKPEIPVSYRFQEDLILKVDGLIVRRLTLNSIALIKELGDA